MYTHPDGFKFTLEELSYINVSGDKIYPIKNNDKPHKLKLNGEEIKVGSTFVLKTARTNLLSFR